MGDAPVWHWRKVQCRTTDVEQTPYDSVHATDVDIPVCLHPTVLVNQFGKVPVWRRRKVRWMTIDEEHPFYVSQYLIIFYLCSHHDRALIGTSYVWWCFMFKSQELCAYLLCVKIIDIMFIEVDTSLCCLWLTAYYVLTYLCAWCTCFSSLGIHILIIPLLCFYRLCNRVRSWVWGSIVIRRCTGHSMGSLPSAVNRCE